MFNPISRFSGKITEPATRVAGIAIAALVIAIAALLFGMSR